MTTLSKQHLYSCTKSSQRQGYLRMAIPGPCHSFIFLKSDSTLIQWTCGLCHSGPHWYIFECKYCKLKTCRPCSSKVQPVNEYVAILLYILFFVRCLITWLHQYFLGDLDIYSPASCLALRVHHLLRPGKYVKNPSLPWVFDSRKQPHHDHSGEFSWSKHNEANC